MEIKNCYDFQIYESVVIQNKQGLCNHVSTGNWKERVKFKNNCRF